MSVSDDDLRRMLARLDPISGVPVEPVTSPQARHLLEQIMHSTQTESDPVVVPRRRRPRAILAAAASVAVLALGIGVAQIDGGTPTTVEPSKKTLALSAPGGDPATQMCLPVDAAALRTLPVAFAGTAIAIDNRTVTLAVDRWFKGGDADEVIIACCPATSIPRWSSASSSPWASGTWSRPAKAPSSAAD